MSTRATTTQEARPCVRASADRGTAAAEPGESEEMRDAAGEVMLDAAGNPILDAPN